MNRNCMVAFIALVLLLVSSQGHAEVYGVFFNAWTETNPGKAATLVTKIQVYDSSGVRGPDAIDWGMPFTLTAPTGEVAAVSVNTWQEVNDAFYPSSAATSFASGSIPPGKYTVRLTDKSGHTFTSSKALLPIAFLPLPVVTFPTDQAIVSSLTPTLKWNAVAGAQLYRITLKDLTRNEPVYVFPFNHKEVYKTTFRIPAGVLWPSVTYAVRVEAWDSDKNRNKRSRSAWITFSTSAGATAFMSGDLSVSSSSEANLMFEKPSSEHETNVLFDEPSDE